MRTRRRAHESSALPRTVTGWTAALLAALLLVVQAADVGHRAAQSHAVCDEHGGLVHADAPHVGAQGATGERGAPGADFVAPDEGPRASHEHCALGPAHRERAEVSLHAAGFRPLRPPPAGRVPDSLVPPPSTLAVGGVSARAPPFLA